MKLSKIFNPLAMVAALTLHAVAETAAAAEKKVRFCSKEYDVETGLMSFTFQDGQVVECNLTDFSADIQKQLSLHGLSQKGGDSFAGAKGNVAEAVKSVSDVIEQLKAGVWRAAPGEGESRPRLGELAGAIARIKGVEYDVAFKAVEAATDEQRKTWRGNVKVKAVIAQIRSEEAAKALEGAAEQEININLG